MPYYDIVLDSFEFTDKFAERLGFKHIYRINEKSANDGVLGINNNPNELISMVRKGARAVIIDDFTIDRKLIAEMNDKNCMLLLPMHSIISKTGFALTRAIYKARMLLLYVDSKDIDIAICSYAGSMEFMNSRTQLDALCKMIGLTDKMIKECLCNNNKLLGDIIGKD